MLAARCGRDREHVEDGQRPTDSGHGDLAAARSTRANVTANFTNVAVASGTAGGTTVTAQDTAPVTAKAAALQPKTVTKVKPKVVSHRKPKATG